MTSDQLVDGVPNSPAAAGAREDHDISAIGGRAADLKGQISWPLFQAGRDVYIIICVIYIFAPYFSNVLVGDPVRGQALWAATNGVAGAIVAICAPFLGAIADASGRRKPWIGVLVALLVPSIFALWWAEPGSRGLGLSAAMILIAFNSIACSFTEIFHNSLLPSIAPERRLGLISGLGLSFANAATLLLLCFVLYAFMLPGNVSWRFIPAHPLFGIDPAQHENSRVVAPITAVWLLLLSLPLFLFTPDLHTGPRAHLVSAVRQSLARVWATVRSLRRYRNVALFLAARMAVNDAGMALALFTGVFAAGVFHWSPLTLTVFGIVLSPFALIGGLMGGWLDDRFGSRWALFVEISGAIAGVLLSVSMRPDRILFVIPYDPMRAHLWDVPFFNTVPELSYLGAAIMVATFCTGTFSSGRTMLVRIEPISKMSEFFGLYALSGTATAFVGPALVGFFTQALHSQRAGFASTILLLLAGLTGLVFVREERVHESS